MLDDQTLPPPPHPEQDSQPKTAAVTLLLCVGGGGGSLIKTSAGGSLDITATDQWEDRNTEPWDQWEQGRGLCTHMTGSVCVYCSGRGH